MEKTFQIKAPNGQVKEISETMAKQLGNQVEVLGEVIDTKFKRRDREEKLSSEEFRKQHIHTDILPDGRKVRRIDKGYERVVTLDKESKPGQARFKDGMYRERKVVEGGREMDYEEWLKTR